MTDGIVYPIRKFVKQVLNSRTIGHAVDIKRSKVLKQWSYWLCTLVMVFVGVADSMQCSVSFAGKGGPWGDILFGPPGTFKRGQGHRPWPPVDATIPLDMEAKQRC
jgi:hypothetical protein